VALTQRFASTDTGAPTATGETGSYQALLDALLVNGYNAKTITITRSGTTATATATSHGFHVNQVLRISGADQSDYNLPLTRITNVTTNTFDYEVANSPTTPATGTITADVAPLGWTTEYSSGNHRSYKQPSGTNGYYLNVSDHATKAYQFRVRLFETVTAAGADATNGTGPTPTDSQVSGGMFGATSDTASATARAWVAFGTASLFMLYIDIWGGSLTSNCLLVGDMPGGGAYDTFLWAANNTSSTNNVWGAGGMNAGTTSYYPSYKIRESGGTGTSQVCDFYTCGAAISGSTREFGATTIVNHSTYGYAVARPRLWECAKRGAIGNYLPVLDCLGGGPFAHGDTFTVGAGNELSGRSYWTMAWGSAKVPIEVSDTWDE
jgi:hypothetical protein